MFDHASCSSAACSARDRRCNRVPEFEDFSKLPYLKAVINEVLRLRPTVPIAIPHASTIDQRMGKYLVPKGAILLVNSWGIYRHEDYFENPDVFDSERFMKNPCGVRPGVDPTGCRIDYVLGYTWRITR
ncbi:hypothetical protein QCA50_004138 [Cerrena zonata]|uniref:Cytochrome P450 n=1 Tax=Cerrena zonata TaxID=2478898 RepID=A0AAW0GGH3_9APHY